ncbi:hypothetical protein B0H14DRAFT_3737033 [Mycena olivaceomarginata]|nr:hypothetical protein B0H14DRAFT_3737033 [Mycena olivaceomarginata]
MSSRSRVSCCETLSDGVGDSLLTIQCEFEVSATGSSTAFYFLSYSDVHGILNCDLWSTLSEVDREATIVREGEGGRLEAEYLIWPQSGHGMFCRMGSTAVLLRQTRKAHFQRILDPARPFLSHTAVTCSLARPSYTRNFWSRVKSIGRMVRPPKEGAPSQRISRKTRVTGDADSDRVLHISQDKIDSVVRTLTQATPKPLPTEN